jgi:hypothetical protein
VESIQTSTTGRRPEATDRKGSPTPEHKASTIEEFCQAHRISRATFYILKKMGKAPRITRLPICNPFTGKPNAKQIITNEDASVWRKAMSEASEPTPA